MGRSVSWTFVTQNFALLNLANLYLYFVFFFLSFFLFYVPFCFLVFTINKYDFKKRGKRTVTSQGFFQETWSIQERRFLLCPSATQGPGLLQALLM